MKILLVLQKLTLQCSWLCSGIIDTYYQ